MRQFFMTDMGVGIVGAGLVGCLTALALSSRGYEVTLFEMRPDPCEVDDSRNLRSINLSLSNRGINAIDQVDPELTARIMDHTVPLYGRMIHAGGKQESQLYGLFGEHNNSIDRSLFNKILIEEVKHKGIRILFNHKLVGIKGETLFFSNDKTYEFDYIIGSDGSHSQFKYQLQKNMRMNLFQEYIDMQYIELYIPPGADGSFQIDKNHLHIWPRENFMLIALPNLDGSFTSTFFSPWSVIEGIQSSDEFVDFFANNFPKSVELLGEEQLRLAYSEYPRGSLMQTSTYPYHSPDRKALVIGDAAHSMVPFYGQGLNCGFEDLTVLLGLYDKHGDLATAFAEYSEVRKKDLDTICKLAMDNYNEMASKVTKTSFLLRKKVDYLLGKYVNGKYFRWIPMYSMISFRHEIPYSKAVEIEESQNKFLNRVEWGVLAAVVVAARAWLWYRRK